LRNTPCCGIVERGSNKVGKANSIRADGTLLLCEILLLIFFVCRGLQFGQFLATRGEDTKRF
jgi:hypothetical protein